MRARYPSPSTDDRDIAVMSEDDLLRMGPADYMNEQQLAFFRRRLLALRAEIAATERAHLALKHAYRRAVILLGEATGALTGAAPAK